MKSKLSGFVDDELERHEEQGLFNALQRGEELRGCWRDYLLIGDALRREDRLHADITGRVMAGLEREPVVLAPRGVAPLRAWQRPVLAMAATLAGVGVVAWVALMPPGGQPGMPATLAQRGAPVTQPAVAAQTVAAPAAPARAAGTRDMREYLAAHQMQSGFLQFRGGTENIRTVSATGKAPAQ